MSGWAFDSDDILGSEPPRGSSHANRDKGDGGNARAKPRRAFFGEDSDDDHANDVGPDDRKRDSLTLASTASVSRRSQRHSRTVVVVDESDDGSPHEESSDDKSIKVRKPQFSHADAHCGVSEEPVRLAVTVKNATSRSTKSDEIASADIVRPTSGAAATTARAPKPATAAQSVSSNYAHWLVREFLQKKYPPSVLAIFDKENPAPSTSPGEATQVETLHRRVLSAADASSNQCETLLEQALVSWDARVHHKQLERPRARRKDSLTAAADPAASTFSAEVLSSSSAAASSKLKSKSSGSSRKKPQLSVTIASDAPASTSGNVKQKDDSVQGDGEYNRLNHPGHTPKAQQSALLAAVIGEPGSTPKASASELKALGFEDVDDDDDDTETQRGPVPTSRGADGDLGDNDDELSLYAKRKRAARRHNKHVYIGEAGRTPTKEYVFFRETPPQFVTETVEAAEEALRSVGGNPDLRRQQLQAATTERFVELQSSDVAKYSIGQRVENLGAQRNVTGLVSNLYGSRLCGSAGPGTVVIDTWEGSDTAPSAEESSGAARWPLDEEDEKSQPLIG